MFYLKLELFLQQLYYKKKFRNYIFIKNPNIAVAKQIGQKMTTCNNGKSRILYLECEHYNKLS